MNMTRLPRNEPAVQGGIPAIASELRRTEVAGSVRGRLPRHNATRARRAPGDSPAPFQMVSTPSRFMKAPCPVSVFQQVSPFSSEAHTYFS